MMNGKCLLGSKSLAVAFLVGVSPNVSAVEGDTIIDANIKDVATGEQVPVAKIPGDIYLRNTNDPIDTIWERIPEYRTHLLPVPPVHESVMLRQSEDDEGQDVYFSVARTDDRFYVRLRWWDPSPDIVTASDKFRDGAAIQFSLGNDGTSYIMGTGPEEPVNIWYWRSDANEIENLAAGGPGSTTHLPDQPVSGDSSYITGDKPVANQWIVVMSRPLEATGDFDVGLNRPQVPVSFALWQGADGQRDGWKIASDGWLILDTGIGE